LTNPSINALPDWLGGREAR